MQDKGMVVNLIDSYANLQRILNADNPSEEAEYQLQLVKTKLETMGIVTTKLDKTANSKDKKPKIQNGVNREINTVQICCPPICFFYSLTTVSTLMGFEVCAR